MTIRASDLVEFASDASFAIDAEARIVAWNAPAQRLLGYTPSEVVGRHCGEVLQATLAGGEPLCHPDCDMLRCFLDCQPCGAPSSRLRHRDGEWIAASMASIALSESIRRLYADKPLAIIFMRDVSIVTPMPQRRSLQLFTLGGFGIVAVGHGIDIGKWKRKQAVTLLKYLVTQLGRPVHHERLIDCLWPEADEGQGRGRLKVTMYYLRRELRTHGLNDDVVKTVGNAYLLRRDAVWVDADVFERKVTEGRALQSKARWGDALNCYVEARNLYRGDYLEEETFADWCAEERERLHELYLEMLVRSAKCHAELGQHTEAVRVCRKALVFDPCRENFHRALMEYLVKCGHPDLALTQYRRCRQALAREFGAQPSPETRLLHQQILKQGNNDQARGGDLTDNRNKTCRHPSPATSP